MGCSTCGKTRVKYQVNIPGQSSQTVNSMTEAQSTLRAAGNPKGASVKPVKA